MESSQLTLLPEWADEAQCKGTSSEIFFPQDLYENSPQWAQAASMAKAICRGCMVREQCLEYGMDEEEGIWGGLTPRERRRLLRRKRA